MHITSSDNTTQYLLNKALKAETLRFAAISDNIANVDTPYFKRSDVVFESELKRALQDKNPHPFPAKRTHHTHYRFHTAKDLRSIQPRVHTEYNTVFRNDKNNVDIEREMVDAAKTALRYQAFSAILSRKHHLIKMLIR